MIKILKYVNLTKLVNHSIIILNIKISKISRHSYQLLVVFVYVEDIYTHRSRFLVI